MKMSLDVLSENMVNSTLDFAEKYNVTEMAKVKINRQSSTIEIENKEGDIKKFAVIYLGVVDHQDNIFYWADSVTEFSKYARSECTQLRESLAKSMLLESSHYALNIAPDAIQEARELYDDGGRYVIDKNDAMLSRFDIDELSSIVFANSQLQGMYNIPSEELTYYFGIISPLS